MLIAALVSDRDIALWAARMYLLTAVEDADFLEDVHAITCTGSSRGPQGNVIARSHRVALQDDGEYRANGEHN